MKLATKLVSVFLLVVLALIAFSSVLALKRDADRYEAILRRDMERVGHYVQYMVVDLGRDHEQMMAMIEKLNAREMLHALRWVRLDASDGTPERPRATVAAADLHADEDGVVLRPVDWTRESATLLAYVRLDLQDQPGAVEIATAAPELARLRRDGANRAWRLGAYLLVQTAAPASRIALTAIRDPRFVWTTGQLVSDALVLAVNTSAGLFLVFGSMPISKYLSNSTDAVGIPPHRLTLGMMIAMLAVFAIILALLRGAAY